MTGADQLERELKLGAWPEFVLPDLSDLAAGVAPGEPVRQDLDAVYFDTPELHLLRRGVTLRFRRGEPPADVWTLKLPSDVAAYGLARREITLRGRHDRLPGQFEDLTRGWALGSRPKPVARMHTSRTTVPLVSADGSLLASLADDAVTVTRGRRVAARFREIEVELTPAAPAELLATFDERLHTAGAEKVAQIPKLSRALGREASEPWLLAARDAGAKPTLAAVAWAQVVALAARLVDLHTAVVLDDDEGVRSAPSVVRDLRANIEVLAELVDPAPAPAIVDRLAALGADVAPLAQLQAIGAAKPATGLSPTALRALGERQARARKRAHGELLAATRKRSYATLLTQLGQLAAAAPEPTQTGKARAVAGASKLAHTWWRKLRDKPDDELIADLPSLARLAAVLALADGSATADRVATLRDLAAARADELAAARRLHSLARNAPAREAWTAGVLAGHALARADRAATRFAADRAELMPKSAWI